MARIWMPLYVADYLADTAHLSAAEHGAYLLLIMHYWTKGKLPDDEEAIRRITRLTSRQWSQSRDVLRSLFCDQWRHKRIDEELAKAIEKSKVNSANAQRRHSERSEFAERTDTQSQSPLPKERKDAAPAASDPEKAFFDRAAETVGRPLAAKLLKAKGGNVALAHAALLTASTKSEPREYLGAIIRGRDQEGKSEWAF